MVLKSRGLGAHPSVDEPSVGCSAWGFHVQLMSGKNSRSLPAVAVTVGALKAQTHFWELLARVEAGEQVTITKHGTPIARLLPVAVDGASRDWPGFWERVDSRLVTLSPGASIKADIEVGRP